MGRNPPAPPVTLNRPAATPAPPRRAASGAKTCEPECAKPFTPSASSDGDFITSAAIGYMTNDGILGGLLGGDIIGGIVGDLLNDD